MICVQNDSDDILVVSEHGFGKRSKIEDYRITNRGGKGVKTINVTEKTGSLVAILDGNERTRFFGNIYCFDSFATPVGYTVILNFGTFSKSVLRHYQDIIRIVLNTNHANQLVILCLL